MLRHIQTTLNRAFWEFCVMTLTVFELGPLPPKTIPLQVVCQAAHNAGLRDYGGFSDSTAQRKRIEVGVRGSCRHVSKRPKVEICGHRKASGQMTLGRFFGQSNSSMDLF
ncbi:MAG: hypothetical protein C0478_05075 [Planctomyces sp.]|nr:hypothetical protein [Planctomyces sp.]